MSLPPLGEIQARTLKSWELTQFHYPDAVARHLQAWSIAAGGPAVEVIELTDWESARAAADDQSKADAWGNDPRCKNRRKRGTGMGSAYLDTAAYAASQAFQASSTFYGKFWGGLACSSAGIECCGAIESSDAIEFAQIEPMLSAFEAGCWMVFVNEPRVYYIPIPTIRYDAGHFNTRPHCETGPAFVSLEHSEWFLNGVVVDEQIVLRPETQTVQQIRDDDNQERKRVRIERFGWPRYLEAISAQRIHVRRNDIEGTREALFRADDSSVLVCACPSTAKVFALEVPPDIETCEQAQHYLSSGLSSRIISAS